MRCVFMNKEKKQQEIEKEKQVKEEIGREVGEDTTKYGEFVSSYFAWISLPDQKEKAEELEEMTKKKKH